MHAVAIVQKIVRPVSAQLDVRNARNLMLAVQALIGGRRLILMELARHWPGAERVLAPLKRLDRLLGNRDVQAVRTRFYSLAAAWLLRSKQPVLIVDWSELKADGRWHLLRAAVAGRGRAMTVYEEVHPEAKKNSRKVQAAFLERLQALLPAGVRPIVITDAGFQNPWFNAVQARGWHWIGRIRHRTRFRWIAPLGKPKGPWMSCKALHPQASTRARSLGQAQIAQRNPVSCRLILVRRRSRATANVPKARTSAPWPPAPGSRGCWPLLARSTNCRPCTWSLCTPSACRSSNRSATSNRTATAAPSMTRLPAAPNGCKCCC